MDRAVRLILGSHCHVPFGASEEEYETYYLKRIKPFVSALYKFPAIPAVLAYSGVLFHWIEKVHPELLMLIENLVARKQAEILGGGYYEPLMPLIPLQDKIGQIEMLTTYIRKKFGKRPLGCWIPAMAWEQHMVYPLNTCGMGYTFLSEGQFELAGLEGGDRYLPCTTEDQGKLLMVFPVSLRRNREFAEKKASDILKGLSAELPRGKLWTVTVFPEKIFSESAEDGGEEIAWHSFFEELSRCESFVEFSSPGRVFRSFPELKRTYFPDSVGLCPGEKGTGQKASVKFPRQFLIDHPEANGIYAKMIFTHVLINQLRGDKSRKRTAREEIWKAQGHDLFCSNEYFGISRPGLRRAAYRALLGAEKMIREKNGFIPSLMNFDFDLDGEGEYLFQDEKLNCYIQLKGAGLFELDYLPKSWNYLDIYPRAAVFTDRFLPPNFSFEDAKAGNFAGSRYFGNEQYKLQEMDKVHGKVSFSITENDQALYRGIEIKKKFQLRKDALTVSYALSNTGTEPSLFLFTTEILLSFPGEGPSFVRILKGNAPVKETGLGEAVVTGAEIFKFKDLKNEVQITLSSVKPFDIWIFPVRSKCSVNSRVSEIYQYTRILPVQSVSLLPGETWITDYTLKF
jgi:hypothetical protein